MPRRNEGKEIREEVADDDYPIFPDNHNNGEEQDYRDIDGNRNFIANYHKSLPHHPLTDRDVGEVDNETYRDLLHAVHREDPDDFEDITLGSLPRVPDPQKLTNPLAGVAFDLEGLDSHATYLRPAPRIAIDPSGGSDNGAEAAGEMAELYWMALCRDIHFSDFGNILMQDAINDLSTGYSKFPMFPYPPPGRVIDISTIFRGFTQGDVVGPYISQFLLKGNKDLCNPMSGSCVVSENDGLIKYGCQYIDQRQWTVVPGIDYLTTNYQDWLDAQDGKKPAPAPNDQCGNNYETTRRRFIRNMRDLANYVHYDDLPQEFLNGCLILLHMQAPCINPQLTFDLGIPYVSEYKKQVGFGTFGPPHILTLVGEVTTRALKAAWYHKWFVHRRLRPESFGGLLHRQLNATSPTPTAGLLAPNPPYPIHPDILGKTGPNQILERIRAIHGSYLLPQAYPEGSPTHPSYPAGHATIAGACVTILKAFFDENFEIPSPVQANRDTNPANDGTLLVPATNPDGTPLVTPLRVGGELNKLASNISIGRNIAGVHYRSDYTESVKLGEEVAISILRDQARTYREDFSFRFHKFDGTLVNIHN